jgi:hypothetical protein
MHKAAMFFVFPFLICFGASLLMADEPTLEPIPRPLPEPPPQLAQDGEPTPAVRSPEDPTDTDKQVEAAGYESAPVADEPLMLEAIQPPPIQSEPPIILHEPAPITDGAPMAESPVIQPAPPVRIEAPATIEFREPTVEESPLMPGPVVERPMQPDATRPPHPTNLNCVRRPAQYRVPLPQPGQQYSRLRYDAAGPYFIRQSSELRPGPGRTATQVTTYEVTRFRPVTYQVRVPEPRAAVVYSVAPGYHVVLQPVAEPPGLLPAGPVRGWLRRQLR